MTMQWPRAILITGASSGLGAALALAYSGSDRTLFLLGRNGQRLEGAATDCRARGATVHCHARDVTDRDGMAEVIGTCDATAPLDLVIANAGISAGTGNGSESQEQARRIFSVNLDGVLNTVGPAIAAMRQRRSGAITIMSSLASFISMPGAPAYCASKAAVRVYGEALRPLLAPIGISVSVVCPGFVRTPMTDVNDFPMPMLMEAPDAARRIVAGVARKHGRIAFPFPLYLAVRFAGCLPNRFLAPVVRRMPGKPRENEPS